MSMVPPKPRYCGTCDKPQGWKSILVENAPWFAGLVAFWLVAFFYPSIFGVNPDFLNVFSNNLSSLGFDNYAQYLRVMNLGWPVVGAIAGFLVSARIRNLYRENRIGFAKYPLGKFLSFPTLYYHRKIPT